MQKVFSLFLTVLVMGAVVPPATTSTHDTLEVSVEKAPIAPDGTTAGAVTDIVLTFADRNPAVDGVGIENGGIVEVVLPDDFANIGGVNTVIVLQGWPQSPRIPFPYATNIAGNTITLTLNGDWLPERSARDRSRSISFSSGFGTPVLECTLSRSPSSQIQR